MSSSKQCPRCAQAIDAEVRYCPHCGADTEPRATRVEPVGPQTPPTQPFQTQQGFIPSRQVKNYLFESVAATICCCPAIGIPAIVTATQVDSLLKQGDYVGAQKKSDTTKMLLIAAVVVGLLLNIAAFFLYLPDMAKKLESENPTTTSSFD